MRQDGFTLIELLIVVGIASILTIALGFQFVGWMARYNVEREIKTMHIDLMTARQRAMQKNFQYLVQLGADGKSYLICEDTNGNGICEVPAESTLPITLSLSKNGLRYALGSDLPGGGTVLISARGMLTLPVGATVNNIWLLSPDTGKAYVNTDSSKSDYFGNVDYDCVSLSTTRIGVGKYDDDGTKTPCATAAACCVK